MAELGTVEALLAELGKALLPLQIAVSSPSAFLSFMLKLGWQASEIPQPLQELGTGLDSLFTKLRKVVGDGLAVDGSVSLTSGGASTTFTSDDILQVKQAVEQIVNGILDVGSAPDAAIPAALRADNFKAVFPQQLISYLLINYLSTYRPSVAFALRALGVVRTRYVPPTGGRLAYIDYSLDFSDLPTVFSHPSVVLATAFGWGSNDFDFRALASQVDNLLFTLGVDTFVENVSADTISKVQSSTPPPEARRHSVLKAVFFERMRPSGRMAAEIRLLELPKNGTLKPGLALMPAFNGLLGFTMQLGPDIAVTLKSSVDLQGGVALLIRPGNPVQMLLGFNNPGTPTSATGSLSVEAARTQLDNAPILILGSPDATRLQYRTVSGLGGVSMDTQNAVDVFAELAVKGLEFVFKPSDADGFIQYLVPGDGVNLGFDLAVGASYLHGFYFRGTSNLEISVPLHIQIGPIEAKSLTVAATPQAGTLPISLGATFTAALGPLAASIENMGLTTTFSFPGRGGNLGPMNLALAFKPPNGVGLVVNAGVVTGGGFLYIDTDHGEYAGALELEVADFLSLHAIGLITTKMPDGSSGFSLLIIVTADFGSGIQLGFGFTLLAVGGLLGLNRVMLLQPLMDGVRTGAIDSIMFPQNVVANAPRIISDLRAIFPPQVGIFLIGPMAKLGWGEPTLISLSLGVIIEIPGDVAILGVLKLALPADDIALILIQVNFAGAIEFDKDRLYFFASLFDSRVLFITIEGEMGVLFGFGDNANFVVSIGGFHPQYNPPPLPFPRPRRIEVDIINESYARIRCDGYFAVTSDSFQFGSHAEFFFGFDAFNVQGHAGFDALLQFSPFRFIVSISASFSVSVFGVGVFGIDIDLGLAGPAPWHANGDASISLFLFSIDVGIDVSWGDSRDTSLPPITVMPMLATELGKQSNWRAVLPSGSKLSVSLRQLDPSEAALVLHPVGTLHISQRAIPLDLTLDKVGNQKPSDANRFALSVTSAGLAQTGTPQELFAPAQFKNYDDAAKLSLQAYSPQDSGIALSASGTSLASGTAITRIVRYDLTVIDTRYRRFIKRFFSLPASLFAHFLGGASVTRCSLSAYRAAQVQPFANKVTVAAETFAVALQSNNTVYRPESASFTSQAAAHDYLNRAVQDDPTLAGTLHVLPQFEVAA
jgi:hypothetical protein